MVPVSRKGRKSSWKNGEDRIEGEVIRTCMNNAEGILGVSSEEHAAYLYSLNFPLDPPHNLRILYKGADR